MTIDSVIFDWGGTLTPWHNVDVAELWSAVCTPHFPADEAAAIASALHAAEDELWQLSRTDNRSATMAGLFAQAGISVTEAFLASYVDAWAPHTVTDPDVPDLLAFLRASGVKVGVLSNTMWPRSWHEEVFRRDGVLEMIDGAVYTSEIDWTKPHPATFRAAMAAVGVADPGRCVFVGDRPYDDVYGAKNAGLRAVLMQGSNVPPYSGAMPDAIITRLADLRPLIEFWSDSPQNGPESATLVN